METTGMEVADLRPAFGAVVTGIDLNDELPRGAIAELRRLFDERSMLVFRQPGLEFAAQDRLCHALIGDETDGPAGRLPRYISNLEPEALAPYGRLLFHVDMMWHPRPLQVLSLYAMHVEPGAATTSLTSGVVAWERLPQDLRERVSGLHARHVTGQVYRRGGDDLLHPERAEERSTVTPIAFSHPRTGRTVLFVSQQMTREVVELPPGESEELLEELFAHLYAPDLVYEHTWCDGDLVVFDNVALQHARGDVDRDGPSRTLRKVIAPVPSDLSDADRPTFANAR
jgi:alpha-ketoglutarate-dependent taurine dioxygenase